MSRHTPGPWRTVCYSVAAGSLVVADCKPDNGRGLIRPRIEEECVANARLIAAAPELLEACKQAIQDAQTYGGAIDDETYAALQAAIRKATGD